MRLAGCARGPGFAGSHRERPRAPRGGFVAIATPTFANWDIRPTPLTLRGPPGRLPAFVLSPGRATRPSFDRERAPRSHQEGYMSTDSRSTTPVRRRDGQRDLRDTAFAAVAIIALIAVFLL